MRTPEERAVTAIVVTDAGGFVRGTVVTTNLPFVWLGHLGNTQSQLYLFNMIQFDSLA